MGLKKRIYSGLNKVFKMYEHAIILEDDCLPNKSFFIFCQTMLNIYQKEKKIAGK